jgi:nucleoside-diphosphate-sugar epimerase
MRILVAGASGAVGRTLLPRLAAAGHQVFGTARTEENAEAVRHSGGEALVADGLDGAAIRHAVEAAAPDVVVHQMTHL